MTSLALDPVRMRRHAERLIAIPSVSPDREGEARVAREAVAVLPPQVERGEWLAQDGRPVTWAFVPGSTPHTVVLLAHADTVGTADYAVLEDARGEAIAFDPAGLRERLLEWARVHPNRLSPGVLGDLRAEEARPGTWLFGRGALDMKSAIAVGVELVAGLATASSPPACGVLLVVTPDEEHESKGMPPALRGLIGLREERGLSYAGVLNLDYVPRPVAYSGAMGKLEVAAYVLGRPTHAGRPFEGADAAQMAAALAQRVAGSRELVDADGEQHGPPPVVLRLRDLKRGYDAQTIHEAWVEFSTLSFVRPLEDTLERFRHQAVIALGETIRRQSELAAWVDPHATSTPATIDPRECVLTYPELLARAGGVDDERAGPSDAREATLARLRALCAKAGLNGPAVVLLLVPPYYPSLPPGTGPLTRAAAEALAGERHVRLESYYPLITDACYVAWRGDDPARIAAHMPALGRQYVLPHRESAALDLDVVSLGPWGYDAHGPFERVNVEFAFERLPRLLAGILERVSTEVLQEPRAARSQS